MQGSLQVGKSPFMVFVAKTRPQVKADHPTASYGDIAQMLKEMWDAMDDAAREVTVNLNVYNLTLLMVSVVYCSHLCARPPQSTRARPLRPRDQGPMVAVTVVASIKSRFAGCALRSELILNVQCSFPRRHMAQLTQSMVNLIPVFMCGPCCPYIGRR
jgi:hypothetical protein